VNTAAIRIEWTFSRIEVTLRPSASVSAVGKPDDASAMSPAATAAATNIMPTNNRPAILIEVGP
jgi:hypothetical protein